MPKLALGRPANIYRTTPAHFALFWGEASKRSSFEAVLEPGFGAVGYVTAERTKQHLFRVSLVPCDTSGEFFWARVEDAAGSIDFGIPALVKRSQVPRLLEVWEAEEAAWCEGGLASPVFPEKWKMPFAYLRCSDRFGVMLHNLDSRETFLSYRAGLHTLRARGEHLAGIFSRDGEWDVFRRAGLLMPEKSNLPFGSNRLSDEALRAFREMSSQYFERVFMTADHAKGHPFLPHGGLLNIPLISISELKP